jgi:hypothetical protein
MQLTSIGIEYAEAVDARHGIGQVVAPRREGEQP